MSEPDMDFCDVLVVGAGPTGLMMAAELTRYGLNCRIIDKSARPSAQSKALAIQPRTLEIFHLLGLSSSFLKHGKKLHAMNPMSGSRHLGWIDLSRVDSPFPFILSLPQKITEEILNGYLESLHCSVEREVELIDLGEAAHLRGPSGEFTLKPKWVIGCDGAHSFVRKHLNLSFLGKALPEVFSLADIEMRWKYSSDEAYAFFDPRGPLAAIPLPGENLYRLIFQLERCQRTGERSTLDNLHVDLPPPTLEEVMQIVHERADPGAVIANPQWLANFHVNSRLTERYQVGNLFLAGDAAHIHSPIGGQGMNTGLQDAFNLAWKMGLVHRGNSSAQLLDSYHVERHAIARNLLKGTEVGTHMVTLKKSWEVSLRNFFTSLALGIPFVQKKLTHSVTQLSLRYPISRFIAETGHFSGGIRAGSRVPNRPLHKGKEVVEIYDLLAQPTDFFVLLFSGDSTDIASLEELTRELPVPSALISLTSSSASVFLDRTGEVHRAFGAPKGAAYVIRPDAYVGYRQTPIDAKALMSYLR